MVITEQSFKGSGAKQGSNRVQMNSRAQGFKGSYTLYKGMNLNPKNEPLQGMPLTGQKDLFLLHGREKQVITHKPAAEKVRFWKVIVLYRFKYDIENQSVKQKIKDPLAY